VQRAGLEVWAGMILGFDHDGEDIFAAHREFLTQAHIAQAMVGMLSAIPKTPLHDRLAAAGRLDADDESPFGTNVIPARLGRDQLRDGYVRLMDEIYEPEAYFLRLRAGLGDGSTRFAPARARHWRGHPWARFRRQSTHLVRAAVLSARLMRRVADPALRRRYRREIRTQFFRRRDPGFLLGFVIRCALHYHHHTLARQMAKDRRHLVNSF
jgi:hypothetical protein